MISLVMYFSPSLAVLSLLVYSLWASSLACLIHFLVLPHFVFFALAHSFLISLIFCMLPVVHPLLTILWPTTYPLIQYVCLQPTTVLRWIHTSHAIFLALFWLFEGFPISGNSTVSDACIASMSAVHLDASRFKRCHFKDTLKCCCRIWTDFITEVYLSLLLHTKPV